MYIAGRESNNDSCPFSRASLPGRIFMNVRCQGLRLVAAAAIFSLALVSCENIRSVFGGKKSPRGGRKGESSIVISDQVSMLGEPATDAAVVSQLSLGETVYATGETTEGVHGSGVEFLEVSLTDGTSGWVRREALVPDAEAGAIMEPVRVHQRPDSLTMTDKRFEYMDMVAVVNENEEWVEVIGKKRRTIGWIRKGVVTRKKEDVANAVYARAKLRQDDALYSQKRLNDIIFNAPYPESYFVHELRLLSSLLSMTGDIPPHPREAPEEPVGFFDQ